MKLKHIFSVAVLMVASFACDQYEVFEKEQYKNVFALISETDNVYRKFFDLRRSESTGYISFSMGGTNPTDRDLTINLLEDPSYIEAYNKANFDMEIDKYARPLPASMYDISALQCVIPAGADGVSIPVKIRPQGLSPDSTYFIAVRVDNYSDYELNPRKNHILFSVRLKNYYARGDRSTSYTLMGLKREGNNPEIMVPGTKIMEPLAANKVRIMAGNEVYSSSLATFINYAMILEIGDDNKVTISSYQNLDVVQIDGDPEYPNIFRIDDDGFSTYKTFLLHYQYTLGGVTYTMKEELRLQFVESEEEII
jgi:Domain of unknown function (DUF1735).